jgi:hypothetical protein
LLAQARQGTNEFQDLLFRYALERLLYRLSVSKYRDRFVLDAPGSQLKLANALFESPIITIPLAAAKLKMSYQGAKKVVEELVKARILTEFPTPTFGLAMPMNMYIARGITAIANRA